MYLSKILASARLRLRCLHESDASDDYLTWMRDSEVSRYLESRFDDWTLPLLRQFIRDCNSSSSDLLLGIFRAVDGRHLGNVKLREISRRHATAEVGIVIGDPGSRAMGFGTEAIACVAAFARDELRLHKLYASAYAANLASIRAFSRAEFVLEGTRRDHVQSGNERDDLVLLGRIL